MRNAPFAMCARMQRSSHRSAAHRIIGFSAGGHVASSAATHWLPANPSRPIRSSAQLAGLTWDADLPRNHDGEFAHAARARICWQEPAPELVELMSNESR